MHKSDRSSTAGAVERVKISAFSAYGPSVADKFFIGLGNGIVNHADGIGLGLSVGSAFTSGGVSMAFRHPIAVGVDLAYGVYQVGKDD